MERVVKILMERDGMSEADAKREVQNFIDDATDLLMEGDHEGIEELLMDSLGLEPDYLEDLLF